MATAAPGWSNAEWGAKVNLGVVVEMTMGGYEGASLEDRTSARQKAVLQKKHFYVYTLPSNLGF